MFTGIIEEIGIISSLIRGSSSGKLAISVSRAYKDVKIGESIAVNGVCLTVSKVRRQFLEFDVSSETLKKSTLGSLKVGDDVNLERALQLTSRLGGHLVTGHVDGVGEIRNLQDLGDYTEMQLSIPSELLRYLVPKGSIAIDGVSLTVVDIRNNLVFLTLVPLTDDLTTLGDKTIGDQVNVEVDIFSKYMEKHVKGDFRGISEETLAKTGFFPMGWIEN